ncbi:MAG: ABC transporter substrate-binding protein [bacterium]|nr:ABC transporter substrate-binding protein [bacterium]
MHYRFPSFFQWKELLIRLSRKERAILCSLVILSVGSGAYLIHTFSVDHTVEVPEYGGGLVEGVVGSPRFLNPLYAVTQDADRDLSEVIYSGLLSYDNKGNLVPDLAATYEVTQDGRSIEVSLKDKVKWHDNAPFSADDVIFTVQTIQNPSYKSPLRPNWIGVTVEKISDLRVRFTLKEPYAAFLERLTLKIIPAHIWKNVPAENFAFSDLNLKPVGTGPFRVTDMIKERSGTVREVHLKGYENYYGKRPYLSSLVFKFYSSEDALLLAAAQGNVDSFSLSTSEPLGKFQLGKTVHAFSLPRYFALFFNLASPTAGDTIAKENIREALLLGTDKERLVSEAFPQYGTAVDSVLPSAVFGIQAPLSAAYDKEKALSLLTQSGFEMRDGILVKKAGSGEKHFTSDLKKGSQGEQVKLLQECLAKDPSLYPERTVSGSFGKATEDAVIRFQEKYTQEILAPSQLTKGNGLVKAGTRAKLNEVCFPPASQEPFAIVLTTVDQPQMLKVAESLKEQWKELGIRLTVQSVPSSQIEQDVIKSRNYEVLLFGEILSIIPDPYPFWHSSQKRDPGLNLSSYENKSADRLLETARKELDPEERADSYQKLQDILLQDLPALPLYDTSFLYVAPKNVQGITERLIADPSGRFSDIENWHRETKRQWSF